VFAEFVPNDGSGLLAKVVTTDADRGDFNLSGDLSAHLYTDYIDTRSIPSGEKTTPDIMGSRQQHNTTGGPNGRNRTPRRLEAPVGDLR
jgi:hypothetical protein